MELTEKEQRLLESIENQGKYNGSAMAIYGVLVIILFPRGPIDLIGLVTTVPS